MRQTLQWLCLLIFLIGLNHPITKAQNVCLDFDGSWDLITQTVPLQTTDFTVEMWFNSNSTPADNRFKRLFSLGTATNRFEVGIRNGQMTLFYSPSGVAPIGPGAILTTNYATNTWYHLAVVRIGSNVDFYVDCVLVYSQNLPVPVEFDIIQLGNRTRFPSLNQGWLGQIDNFRVWSAAKTLAEIDLIKNCGLGCDETDLLLSWNFDEGTPNGDNTARTTVEDCSPNGYNGTLSLDDIPNNLLGFALTGTTSNYVPSTAPVFTPSQTYNNLTLEINDYPFQTNLLTEICSGDPVHFSLLKNGVTPPPASNVTVDWFYREGTNTATPLPSSPFSGFAFAVPQEILQYACGTSTTGYVDRTFYAVTSVSDPVNGWTCTYISDEYDLRICCPIPDLTVDVTPDLLCEEETQTVTVSLSPNLPPFIQTPGQYVDIEWYFNGNYIGFTDQTSFTYTPPVPTVNTPTQLCFEAQITNCAGKQESFQGCITVDPEPVCGQIIGWPQPNPLNMTLVNTSPHLIYEICPGQDAKVAIDPTTPFSDCIPQWQYSFDQLSWTNMGYSNTEQNTNVLPTSAWGSNTSIFYRIECAPLSNPSGCDPCYSNIIEVQLKAPLTTPIVTGNHVPGSLQVCKGDRTTLRVSNTSFNRSYNYVWYCDGLVVGTGKKYVYNAEKSACYWVEATDQQGCYTVTSQPYCVEVCEVVAILSCPLVPNECAEPGMDITLSACDSYSTCSNPNLQYTWYVDGVMSTTNTCTLTHTPALTGTTYKVEIVDLTTGCTATAMQTIVPCVSN